MSITYVTDTHIGAKIFGLVENSSKNAQLMRTYNILYAH